MTKALEKLWNEYLSNECSSMDSDEERRLAKKALKLHEKANALLSKDQEDAVEAYIDALCDLQAISVKRAFFKGCEFSVSFLLETVSREK